MPPFVGKSGTAVSSQGYRESEKRGQVHFSKKWTCPLFARQNIIITGTTGCGENATVHVAPALPVRVLVSVKELEAAAATKRQGSTWMIRDALQLMAEYYVAEGKASPKPRPKARDRKADLHEKVALEFHARVLARS